MGSESFRTSRNQHYQRTVESSNMATKKMTVVIESLGGKKFMEAEVKEGDTVYSVKKMIFEELGIEPAQQKLSFQDQVMEDDNSIAFYNIKEGSIINLAVIEFGEDFGESSSSISLRPID